MVEARERTIRWLRERVDRLRAATVRATDLIASLRENNARLRAEVRDLKDERAVLASRAEKLEAELEKLRATRSVLSKALFGSKSERQSKPRSGRKRGQQPGAVGYGRMQRPELGERTEKRNPPKDARAFLLREALRRQRRAGHDRHRDRGQGPQTQNRPAPLAPQLRLRVLAPGSDGGAGAAAVRHHALRDQRVDLHSVRALRLLPSPCIGSWHGWPIWG